MLEIKKKMVVFLTDNSTYYVYPECLMPTMHTEPFPMGSSAALLPPLVLNPGILLMTTILVLMVVQGSVLINADW